ncbi:MAG: cardiolipin synthase [Prevotella sp.]|nr:cardiolipin synthase [Prevotella sp.]
MNGVELILIVLYQVVIILTIIRVVMDNRQPAKTMAWGLVIWFVPIVGIVLYFFFGTNTRRERMVSQRSLDQLSRRSMLGFVEQRDLQLPSDQRQTIELFMNENFSLPFKDSGVEVYTDGYGFFPSLLRSISRARSHIHIDIYIFCDDALGRLFSDALIAKAREGVEVRLIYDDVGCWNVKSRFFEHMREEGIEVVPFLPVRFPTLTSKVNYRNHRKIFIIDGCEAYIGGMNIAKRYVDSRWRDTMVRVTDSAVYGLQQAFLVDWYFADRTLLSDRKYYPGRFDAPLYPAPLKAQLLQTVTSGPANPYQEIMQGYVRIILSAKRYVYIETPYFLPTETVLFALKTAAACDVDVRLLVPYRGDARLVEWASRSYLREAAEAGVHVSLYQPGFLHSKLIVSDDSICSCGSANVDFRSFENNFEANVFVYGEEASVAFRRVFEADEQQSVLLTDVPGRIHPGFLQKLLESVVRMLAPLM